MGRKHADDPKVSVSLRVRRSVLAAYQSDADWRERMHEALVRGLAPAPVVAVKPAPVPKALPMPPVSRQPQDTSGGVARYGYGMDGKPLPARGPRPKTGKR